MKKLALAWGLAAWLALPAVLFAADSKLTDLPALDPVSDDDILYCVDDPGGTPVSSSCTVAAVAAAGSSSVVHNSTSGLTTGDPHTQYVFSETLPGAPAAGSCDRNGQLITDTTNELPYFCSDGAGGNPRGFDDLGDAYNQVTGESGSATAVGSSTLAVSCTPNCTTTAADASPDTLTITISDHVKSQILQLSTDGTQCGDPTYRQINSGWRGATIICADNDGSTIYGLGQVPDSWAGGTFTVELQYVQTAADTNALNSDIAAACRSAGDTMNNTWGTEVAMDDAAVTGSSRLDHLTSGAITPDGTCAAGDTIFFRWQMDATGTTTAVATLHFLAMKMEYTVTGAGSD